MKNQKSRLGFTFLEILIALGILSLIVSFATLAVNVTRKTLDKQSAKGAPQTAVTAEVVTVGNNSFIPLTLGGNPDKNMVPILQALAEFESKNPEKVILDKSLIWQQDAYGARAYVFGLLVHHKPKVVLE